MNENSRHSISDRDISGEAETRIIKSGDDVNRVIKPFNDLLPKKLDQKRCS